MQALVSCRVQVGDNNDTLCHVVSGLVKPDVRKRGRGPHVKHTISKYSVCVL